MFWLFLDLRFLPLILCLLAAIRLGAAAPLNYTIDDQDFGNITYTNPNYWLHDPLIGWENDFYNGSRSYTYVPGASALFTFTGFSIYLQGPSAPDQARRRVFIDGQDMGAFDWIAPDRTKAAPFYSKTDLTYTTHTVVVTHNDTADKILALDAWIITYDLSRTPLPYTTTTVTQTAPTATITRSLGASDGIGDTNGTVAGNPDNSNQNSPKSYSTIIVGIVVPIVFLAFLCMCAFCIYRNRRTRSAQRRRESFREKFSRRQPIHLASPLTPAFEGGALSAGGAAGRRRRSSDEARAMSPHTFASTRYSTAPEHVDNEYELDQGITRGGLSPTRNVPVDVLDPSAAVAIANNNSSSTQSSLVGAGRSDIRPSPMPATFDPPAEWRTTLSSHGFESSTSPSNDILAHSHNGILAVSALAGAASTGAGAGGRLPRTFQSGADAAYQRGGNNNNTPKQSTVYSESDSSHSFAIPPSRFYLHQPDVNLHDRDGGFGGASPVGNAANPHSSSVLRRFSTAIVSTMPFARPSSRPTSRHSNSHVPNNNSPGGGNNSNDPANTTSQNDGDLENNGSSRGYFHGVNHFNLGIPLNYRPTATAAPQSQNPPTTSSPEPTRHSQNLGFNDIWLGADTGGGSSNGNGRPTAPPIAPGSTLVTSPFDDFAFSSYTRQTRERVQSYPPAGEEERTDTAGNGNGGNATSDTAPRTSTTESGEGGDKDSVMEPEEKEEKIRETLDGDTMHEEGDDQSRWSVGHRTLASQDGGGGASSTGHGLSASAGVTRQASSASRQRSIRSTADQGRQVIPPPYSVYISPDTNISPPSGS